MTEDERVELMGACGQALDLVLNRGEFNARWILLTEWRPEEGDTEQKSGLAMNLPAKDVIMSMRAAIAALEEAIERLQSGPIGSVASRARSSRSALSMRAAAVALLLAGRDHGIIIRRLIPANEKILREDREC